MSTAISARHSITFRMTVAVCTLLLIFQVVLAILAFYYFKRELKNTISAQQLSLLTVVAQNIDQKLGSSSNVITDVARRFPAEAVKDSNAAQRFLDDRPGTLSHFDNGIYLFSKRENNRRISLSARPPRSRYLFSRVLQADDGHRATRYFRSFHINTYP